VKKIEGLVAAHVNTVVDVDEGATKNANNVTETMIMTVNVI
jgi:hypothetical protein